MTASWLLLATALVSGAALMWPLVDAGPLVLDEHGSYWIVGPDNPKSLLERSLNFAATPPLSFLLQKVSLAIGGESPLAMRVPTAICYLLAIIATFALGRELLGPFGGGLAAVLFAWHPAVLDEVRIARMYGPSVLFAALAFWCTVRWRRAPNSLGWGLAWAFVNAGLVWSQYVNVPVVGMELVVLAFVPPLNFRQGRRALYLMLLAFILLLVALVPLYPTLLYLLEWGAYLTYDAVPRAIWQVVGPLWWIGLPAGLFAGVVFARRLPSFSRSANRQAWLLLLIWGIVPLFVFAVASQGTFAAMASNPRYRLAFTPASACLLAACLACFRWRAASMAAVLVTLVATWGFVGRSPFEPTRVGGRNARDWKAMAEYVQQHGEAGEPIFVQSGLVESNLLPAMFDDDVYMDYISCRLGRFYLKTPHPRYGLPARWYGIGNEVQVVRFYADLIDSTCNSSQSSVWVACATDTDLNRMSLAGLREILQRRNMTAVDAQEFSTAVLIRYRCNRNQ